MKKDRFLNDLTEDENKMLDLMAGIIVKGFMRIREEEKRKGGDDWQERAMSRILQKKLSLSEPRKAKG
jgi:hypothetical protein